MQNLMNHPKRQYVILQKLLSSLFKYNARNYGVIKVNSANHKLNNEINRLCFPISYGLYIKVNKELNELQSLFLRNNFSKARSSVLCNTRYFSTNTTNKQSSKGHDESLKTPDKNSKRPNGFQVLMIKLTIAVFALFIITSFLKSMSLRDEARISWNDVVNEFLLKGQIMEINIYPNSIYVVLKPGATYKGKLVYPRIVVLSMPNAYSVEEKIRQIEKHIGIPMEEGIPVKFVNAENGNLMAELFMAVGILLLFLHLFKNKKLIPKFNLFGDMKKANFTLVDPVSGKGVRFNDVAGLREAKIEVMEFVDYLKNPERYKKLGAKVPRGALLLGPPGCGKTLLAKAVATESNVPFLSMNGSEFIEVIGGLGAARVRSLFAEAKKRSPSIIYIDEIDAIGKQRYEGYGNFGNSEIEGTLNQLLVEMDGMTTSQEIIVLASTNRPNVLDKALLRRGRFDRHILIDLPTLPERQQIFECHLKRLNMVGKPEEYTKMLAQLTPGFSGADIANVCNEAALHAASNGQKKVSNSNLMYAIDKVLGGTVKKSSTLTPSEKKVIVYHEAGHALTSWLLENINPLIKVTVVPRTNKRLGFTQYSDLDLKFQSVETVFQNMCVMLGGRVAENIMFNRISTKAQNDLKKVTEIAYKQVQQYGMSPLVGLVSFKEDLTSTKTKKPYSKKLAGVMDSEVRRIITEAYRTTENLLLTNKHKLVTLAEALMKHETLTYKEIEILIGPPAFRAKELKGLQTNIQ